jgi:hypothetical protein
MKQGASRGAENASGANDGIPTEVINDVVLTFTIINIGHIIRGFGPIQYPQGGREHPVKARTGSKPRARNS